MFNDKNYSVENALSLYANSYAHFPAKAIYDREIPGEIEEVASRCHIYLIGLLPKIFFTDMAQVGNKIITSHTLLGQEVRLDWKMPDGAKLSKKNGEFFIQDSSDNCLQMPEEAILARLLKAIGNDGFKVLYIGQAYGTDGSRNALDRLRKHETLQKISIQGIPEGYNLNLLLLEIHPGNRTVTLLNPFAKDDTTGSDRISQGVDKLFNTSMKERITLYEASLIRYFEPHFNKEFKNSFPSTNMKLLEDCYSKDFSAVIAEIYIDEIPFNIYSDKIDSKPRHYASFDLHEAEERRVFFCRD